MSRKAIKHGRREGGGKRGPRRLPNVGVKTNVGDPQVRTFSKKEKK